MVWLALALLRSLRSFEGHSLFAIQGSLGLEALRSLGEAGWWARLGSNQRPLRCERSALPLSYAPFRVKSRTCQSPPPLQDAVSSGLPFSPTTLLTELRRALLFAIQGSLGLEALRSLGEAGWWARLGLNQRPLRCQRSALPLSYAPEFEGSSSGTDVNRIQFSFK